DGTTGEPRRVTPLWIEPQHTMCVPDHRLSRDTCILGVGIPGVVRRGDHITEALRGRNETLNRPERIAHRIEAVDNRPDTRRIVSRRNIERVNLPTVAGATDPRHEFTALHRGP